MFRTLLAVALATAPVALAGCDAKLLSAALEAANAADSNAPKVRVTGSIYAPAAQVAVVSAGGLNYAAAARSDEKGVANAKVSFATVKAQMVPQGSVQTDSSGRFTIEVPENTDYAVTATFEAKDGTPVTLTGLIKVSGSAPSFQLDAAHNMVASKLLADGLTTIDQGKLDTALSQMASDLSAVSTVPTPTSRSAAAAAFDTHAGAATKATVSGMK
jgi:folylpolyglutamate synthase/dihydropteroate synthase